MDDLARLAQRIPGYAGYGVETSRHRADQQVRVWVGERLAAADARLGISSSPLAAHFERVIRACAFGDQTLLKSLERRTFSADELRALYALDLQLVETAATADQLDLPSFEPLLDRLEELFARRTALIADASAEAV